MYAQRKPQSSARRPGHRHAYQRPTIRARVGLALRQDADFGPLGDAEAALRSAGLGLAPLAVSDGMVSEGGVTILPSAQATDLDAGVLKALVVPGGRGDCEAGLRDVVARALAQGAPVLAFGPGVNEAARAAGVQTTPAPAALIDADGVHPLQDMQAVDAVAREIG